MSDIDSFPLENVVVQPKATQSFFDPSVEYTARQLLGSYFGPRGLMSQPIPVPIRQTAGLGPLEIQARNMARRTRRVCSAT